MSLNDDITELLDKVLDVMSPQDFLRHIRKYRIEIPDIYDLSELKKEFLEFAIQFVKGEVSFKELTLLMSPILREAMKYVLVKVLNESEQYSSPEAK